MIIPIDDDYRIDSDAYCWRVSKKSLFKKDGKLMEQWKPLSFHGSIGQAVRSLHNRLLRETNTETLSEAIAEMERVSDKLSRSLEGKLEIAVIA